MKQLKLWILAAILIISGTTSFASSSDNKDNPYEQSDQASFIPKAPDYADPTMWIVVDDDAEGLGADVFYVVSTWEEDWNDANGRTCHYADVWNATHSHHVLVVSGYSGSEYPAYKDFINVGDIHSCEPWLYSECLAKNIKVRAKEWRKLHSNVMKRGLDTAV